MKGSKNAQKARKKAAKATQQPKHVREDFAHQTSHRLVIDGQYQRMW